MNISGEDLNRMFPIASISLSGRALVIHRSSTLPDALKRIRAKRGKVVRLSRRSLSRLAYLVTCSTAKFYSIVTLTFGPNYPINGKIVKSMLNKLLVYMKRHFGDFDYYWFLEFQRRGAPHFHLVTSLIEPNRLGHEQLAFLWAKICEPHNWWYTPVKPPYGPKKADSDTFTQESTNRQHRRKRTWEALRSEDGAARYAVKYATKTHQKSVPPAYRDVGRFWGISHGAKPEKGVLMMASEEQVRQILWLKGRDFKNWAMLPKYVFF